MAPKRRPPARWVSVIEDLSPTTHARLARLLETHLSAGDRVSPRLMHLIWIAVDSTVTHLFPRGAKRHIEGALECGATVEEIFEVLAIASTTADIGIAMALPVIAEVTGRDAGLPAEVGAAYQALGHDPERRVLDDRTRELIYLALYSSPALVDADRFRDHARRAVNLGASDQDLIDVVHLASGISLHSLEQGAPLIEEALAGLE